MNEFDSSQKPRREAHHDFLLITAEGEYRRFPSEQRGESAGCFTRAPEAPAPDAAGTRKVLGLARQGDAEQPRGPALAILPIKPEPAGSACGACYLLNLENVNPVNPWLDADPAGPEQPAPRTGFEVLLAGPGGKVYHVRQVDAEAPVLREVDLEGEAEIWSQLRNGCIAGSAEYISHPDASSRVVPLVNVTSLMPLEP